MWSEMISWCVFFFEVPDKILYVYVIGSGTRGCVCLLVIVKERWVVGVHAGTTVWVVYKET